MASDEPRWPRFNVPKNFAWPPTQNVTSYNQSGGITAHTVNNFAPPDRVLDDRVRADLLKLVPKDRRVDMSIPASDPEAAAFEEAIWSFLKKTGYTMGERIAVISAEPLPRGQTLDLETDPAVAHLIIGSRP